MITVYFRIYYTLLVVENPSSRSAVLHSVRGSYLLARAIMLDPEVIGVKNKGLNRRFCNRN